MIAGHNGNDFAFLPAGAQAATPGLCRLAGTLCLGILLHLRTLEIRRCSMDSRPGRQDVAFDVLGL